MIKEFTDLDAWKESHKIVLIIYKITETFPKKEQVGLSSQMERAAVSITSNIAEGFGRFTYKEKCRFYYISSGSLSELKNQLIIAKDLNYISEEIFDKIKLQTTLAHKLIKGLINTAIKFDKNNK